MLRKVKVKVFLDAITCAEFMEFKQKQNENALTYGGFFSGGFGIARNEPI